MCDGYIILTMRPFSLRIYKTVHLHMQTCAYIKEKHMQEKICVYIIAALRTVGNA